MSQQPGNAFAGTRPRRLFSWRAWLVTAMLAGAAVLGCTPAPPAPPPKAPEVDVALPVQENVTDYAIFTGSVQAEKSVNLVAQVTGYLKDTVADGKPIPTEGSDVNAGDPLFLIDPRVYQAALDQAKAATNQASQRLASAQDTYSRDLASPAATPQATAIQDQQALEEAKAALEAARAAQQSSQLNLNFTDIRAPFAGRISRRNVDPGNLVQMNVTVLASIVQLDPVYAYFDVDERTLLRIRKLVQEGKIPPRSTKGADLPVHLALSDEKGFTFTKDDVQADAARRKTLSPDAASKLPPVKLGEPRHAGVVKIVDNQENVQTGTLRLWGEFHNPEPRMLSPGMFARIELPIGPPRSSVLINEAALVTDQGRQLLYVVGPPDANGDCEADARYVTTGPEQDQLRVIESGLEIGEKVVLNGLQRVRDKGKVRIRNVVVMPRGDKGAADGNGNGPGAAKADH